MSPGEEKAWESLGKLNPDDVCVRTDATFDASSGLYTIKSFGKDIFISHRERKIFSHSPNSDVLLQRLGYFFNFSVLCYLTMAKDMSLTGRLLKPANMKSGQLFFRGSHVLPLDKIAQRFGNDTDSFLKRGEYVCGERLTYGDASLRLLPLPRVPAILILWSADEEFLPRADLLFDSSVEIQLPIDVIWSIAMLSVLVML
ncbi:MAG TPA: hypothetical protein DCP92_11650 [Nitrospiraceae bacterium]|jgi:hypothetical protein|nr:hypothetical protein [Nitrospiraceae bacterium]